jgi:RNA-dependent RNA polymerase
LLSSGQGNFGPLAYEPARLAARWSQAFSATDPSVTLRQEEIEIVEDKESSQGYLFTDGCCTISPDLSRAVWAKLRRQRRRISKTITPPSAFQFRLGGAKGVVIQDNTLSGKVIRLRPSQTKFDAPDVLTLDIQSTSIRPKGMFLNRPLILLLEHLGVEHESVIALQNAVILDVQSIRTSLTQASLFSMQHGLGGSFHLPSLFNNLNKLLELDIDDTSTFRSELIEDALYCSELHILRELKHRARIIVPGSATLQGAADEWDCLEEGEIYATVCDQKTGRLEHITGRVLITRSPQIHPGDLQFVTAVRKPELEHLRNVVIFSCKYVLQNIILLET